MKQKVLVSVPNVGTIHKMVSFALLKLIQDKRYKVNIIQPTHNPYENNLHHIVNDFMAGDYDFWLNIDSDNPPMANPLDLIELNKDVMGLPTPVWHFTGKTKGERPIYENAYKYVPESDAYKEWPVKEGLQRVNAVGTGCLKGGTLILNENRNGIKIENIKIGDYVLNHLGNKTIVEAVLKRKYKGDVYKIKPRYYTQEITITPEHPILIYNKDNGMLFKKPTELNNQNDFLVLPLPKIKEDNRRSILISDFVKEYKVDKQFIFSNHSQKSNKKVSFKYLSKKYNIGWSVFQTVVNSKEKNPFDRHKTEKEFNRIKNILKKENYQKDVIIKIKNKLVIDKNLLWLFGIYIAEGSACKSEIEFSLSIKETLFGKRICEIMKDKFNLIGRNTVIENRRRVCFSSIIVAKFFNGLFGKGAKNKIIPQILLNLHIKKVKILLEAFIDGDGHRRKESISCATISKNLALQIRDIYLRLGELTTLNWRKINDSYIKDRKISSQNTIYTVTKYPNTRNRIGFIDKNYCYLKFNFKKDFFSGFVYNFQTRDENTYCLSGFSVHNCILISRRVFENSEMRRAPFQRTWNHDGTVERGNDISFCELATKNNFEIYAHFDFRCQHFVNLELHEVAKAFYELYK